MKVHCPNCPNVILEFDVPIKEVLVNTLKCGNCGVYVSRFSDQLGVTYISHSLTKIQEMRDETKQAKSRLQSSPTRSNRKSKKRESLSTSPSDNSDRDNPKQIEGTNE